MTHTRKPGINLKFVVKGLLIAVPAILILAVIGIDIMITQTPTGRPPAPTPPPPTILAPQGDLPAETVAFQEWVQYRGNNPSLSGSSFFMRLADGTVVGVTTAHSVIIGNPNYPITRFFFSDANKPGFTVEFDTLHGKPGRMSLEILTNDYVLLRVDQPVAAKFVLLPDRRGGPQPGERVSLFSGLGDGHGRRRILEGTTHTVGESAVWILMDEWTFDPSAMSGSPVLSQHTGRVVGMVIAVTPRNYRPFPKRYQWLVGIHPVGSLVRLAESAETFSKFTQ
ncbi:MAG: trypsin-like peptidase domain-containing protein [Anaerolineae bacterium]|nr:trypsin-like peptidase domain-containing protein [Anaerolineae bacterium]